MLLGGHDKVVRVVLVVNYVFEVDARHLVQLLEELLVEYERYAADLRYLSIKIHFFRPMIPLVVCINHQGSATNLLDVHVSEICGSHDSALHLSKS